MKINTNIEAQINEFPEDIREIAIMIMKELESNKRTRTKIEEMIKEEVRELILGEDS